ncbi:MAG: Asp-tRNA(Asn)/Glu-tRNA(Gln) amidotransferase subunit GatB [Syntrophomonadaceae bacterium]|jgi:aspartyl-tRNA(Asn)/glutamyl-tRNA(Gln) amidotransferase subunit B|nr:Asp-tRNA(Asn)/Glu-tRNA(Gln) amidotransferase subunit GatB [Bacillota bacterium]NLM88257.1 Asp-tRNA(Asn)/Glu-tRNA(Gln) amidotransferase subunit GatB [Syntrophomonadaceae bacterium]HAA08947.1 Asp-tRNA(Asn)/Glu-tRNA(Gln) amidotransferase GatCAB subunit B [Syntrophomonas sp.]HQA49601.1 Asp-tRNA(Asn)/Glu-tRNA(Gln) amidotransferase subunit GatB [Syntrophomonadaceae bacterium]HQD89944.1 Asp-tRNA(Asn)/Glu-tRNA(Gln) amidotransferase subunit GatB [Syntrophomonadaceae bacterium]
MDRGYEVVIGLEVHVELKTATKIFCSCSTAFGAEPNTQVCPVCSGFPGALPVLNRQAVEYAIRTGLALNCEIAETCKFDRKNYFYPDLPRAYQISQYDQPICKQGYLDIDVDDVQKRIGITRAHLEEDAGKLIHQGSITTTTYSLVNLNRSGVPLMEIVSEPDMRSGAEARAYLEKLRSMMLFAGVSDCKMEEGSLRCDANVSVRPRGETKLGTRVEIKNLNSFRSLERAIEYEAQRQIEALEDGETIVQETRTWDEEKQVTRSMRSKEEAEDYRYFPDPDLPPVRIEREWVNRVRASMPEMPDQAQQRLVGEHGLSAYDAGLLTSTPETLKFFDEAVASYPDAKVVSNWMMGELSRLLNQNNMELKDAKIQPQHLTRMLQLMDKGTISGKMAKVVFEEIFSTGKTPDEIIKEKGMEQISDKDTLQKVIDEVVEANTKVVEDYKNGKEKAFGFLIGQIMKATRGQANPALVNELLREKLKKE